MSKKEKKTRIDGLDPKDLKNIHRAVRQVWSWSQGPRLVRKRCMGKDGFPRCENCRKRVPKIQVDHIHPVGEVGGPGYIQKMFIPSKRLRGICQKCHAKKTKEERALAHDFR